VAGLSHLERDKYTFIEYYEKRQEMAEILL
jgi:hypothetical protein